MADIEVKSDLFMAVANLIEMEHHARFSYMTTGDESWVNVLEGDRETRAELMKDLERQDDSSQLHCYNKHTLSFIFRCMEVGDKFLSVKDIEKAKQYYFLSLKYVERFFNLNISDSKTKENALNKIKSLFK